MIQRLTILFACVAIATINFSCSSEEAQDRHPNQLLLISFDGFRYDYLEFTDTPNFDSLVAGGVRSKGMIPVFPSKTFPNHYSIATGLYPEHTGLVGNTMYDPQFEQWYRLSDRDAVEDPRWYGGEPIWNTAEKQGLRAGTMFWVGSEAPIQNIRPTYWKVYDESMSYEARIDTVVKWLSYPEGKSVDFATLYFEMVDAVGHRYSLQSDTLNATIRRADQLLGYLKQELRVAGEWEATNLLIVSDHGMTNLSAERTIMLDDIIDMEDVERISWNPATMIQPKEGKTNEMCRALKEQQSENHYRVYRKEELPERFHLKNHRRVPELIVVADLGYTLLNEGYRDRFLKGLPAGTHGYDNAEKEMQALFIGSGPAFKQGVEFSSFQNIHIYELMTHLLDIEPAPNDGSLDSVRTILK